LADDLYSPQVTDFTEALDKKYIFKNALTEGRLLPKEINELIGFGAYAPMNKLRDVAGHEDVAMAIGFAKVNSDIFMSLSTPLGTRFMNPEFGSNLFTLLFEPYDNILIDAIKINTIQALTKDVHKITLISVVVDSSQQEFNLLSIRISYQIINTPLVGNYVFPWVKSPEPIRS
jgi:phage baseplate assembly protein W